MSSIYLTEKKFQIVMESLSKNVAQTEIFWRKSIYVVQLTNLGVKFIQCGKRALSKRMGFDKRCEVIRVPNKIIGDQSIVLCVFKKSSRGS